MISRQLLVKLLTPLILLCFIFAGTKLYIAVQQLPSNGAHVRNNSSYEQKIIAIYPATKGTFTITKVTIEKKHWAIVEIKNVANTDTLHVLLYDPLRSASGLQIVAGPTTRDKFDSLMSPAQVMQKEGN